MVDLYDLAFDDANREKMHAHGVSLRRALEVLDGAPKALPNRAADGAEVMIVGPDASGTFVTIPVDPTPEYGVWRPRTAYPSSAVEVGRYDKMRKR